MVVGGRWWVVGYGGIQGIRWDTKGDSGITATLSQQATDGDVEVPCGRDVDGGVPVRYTLVMYSDMRMDV